MTRFQFFRFSTFLITADDGKNILIDPYIDDHHMREEDGGKAPAPVILAPGETFAYTPKNK